MLRLGDRCQELQVYLGVIDEGLHGGNWVFLGVQESDHEGVFGQVDTEGELTIHDCFLTKRVLHASRGRDVLPVLYTRSRPQDCPRNTNPGVAISARRSKPQARMAMPRFVFLAGRGRAPAPPTPKTPS